MRFSTEIINFIHNASKKFVEDNYNDELIFFDEFWKIYESGLQTWIGKPPKKWSLKLSRRRFPRVIGMTDGSEAIELVTPKILEVVATSYTYIGRVKEKLTLAKIEEIIKKRCGKKLPYSVILQAVGFFAPIIFRDLKTKKGIVKEEPVYAEPSSQPQQEEKKEYIMYTDENLHGIRLTKTEYTEKKEFYESQATGYKFIIDEVKSECFFNGRKIEKEDKPVEPAWRAFIYLLLVKKSPGGILKYRDIFKAAWPGEKYFENHSYKSVEKWISMFRSFLDDKLRWLIKGQLKREFVFQEIVGFSFCVFQRMTDTLE